MTPSHLPLARLQHNTGAEQAPELSQQREEDVEDVGPTANGEEEDEEATHPYQHRLVNQPPTGALLWLLCKDAKSGWPLGRVTLSLPQPHNQGTLCIAGTLQGGFAYSPRMSHTAPYTGPGHPILPHIPSIQPQDAPYSP